MPNPAEPSGVSPPLLRRARDTALAVVPFLALLALAYCGIDFGRHWDEPQNKINAVSYSLRNDFTLLPEGYTYPGVNYWLTFGTLAPELIRTAHRVGADAPAFEAALLPVVNSHEFLIRLRHVYAFITALTAAWIYLGVWVWGGNRLAAMACALMCATSWEVVYHARWVAPDTILMHFGALTLFLLAIAWKRRSAAALRLAAVAAGFACGSKYPGGLLLLPVLLVPILQPVKDGGIWRLVLRCAGLSLLFAAAFLVTTPGAALQPIKFYQSLVIDHAVYAKAMMYGYTVSPGLPHLWKIFLYFGTSVFSTFQPVALLFFGLALVGTCAVIGDDPRGACVVLLFPILYALYFASLPTMIVRNYLVLVPFVMFLAGRGLAWLHRRLPSSAARTALVALVSVLIAVNAVDQVRASLSVAHRGDTTRYLEDFARYAANEPNRTLLVSDRLSRDLNAIGRWPQPNMVAAKPGPLPAFNEYVSYYSETVIPRQHTWQTNRPGTFLAVFGPREVNLDYYTGWWGDDRIISLSASAAAENGVIGHSQSTAR
jgi:Dolichyl-phosphate-mannose-protein mannosyltransferase